MRRSLRRETGRTFTWETRGDKTMADQKLPSEQEKRLLAAIFADPAYRDEIEEDDEFPKTITEKVAYAEHCTVSSLDFVGWAIKRLSRFHRLLVVSGDEQLPGIIAYNEAKVARDRLIRVQDDINDAVNMMTQIMDETQPKEARDDG